jgi:hypothetical protein
MPIGILNCISFFNTYMLMLGIEDCFHGPIVSFLFLWIITTSKYSQNKWISVMVVGSFDFPSVFESFSMLLVADFSCKKQNEHGKNKLIMLLGLKLGFDMQEKCI